MQRKGGTVLFLWWFEGALSRGLAALAVGKSQCGWCRVRDVKLRARCRRPRHCVVSLWLPLCRSRHLPRARRAATTLPKTCSATVPLHFFHTHASTSIQGGELGPPPSSPPLLNGPRRLLGAGNEVAPIDPTAICCAGWANKALGAARGRWPRSTPFLLLSAADADPTPARGAPKTAPATANSGCPLRFDIDPATTLSISGQSAYSKVAQGKTSFPVTHRPPVPLTLQGALWGGLPSASSASACPPAGDADAWRDALPRLRLASGPSAYAFEPVRLSPRNLYLSVFGVPLNIKRQVGGWVMRVAFLKGGKGTERGRRAKAGGAFPWGRTSGRPLPVDFCSNGRAGRWRSCPPARRRRRPGGATARRFPEASPPAALPACFSAMSNRAQCLEVSRNPIPRSPSLSAFARATRPHPPPPPKKPTGKNESNENFCFGAPASRARGDGPRFAMQIFGRAMRGGVSAAKGPRNGACA